MDNLIIKDKASLREKMRQSRKLLSGDLRIKASERVCEKLIQNAEISEATPPNGPAVAVYFASPAEIDLSEFVKSSLERNAKIVAPRWNGETYELARVKSLNAEDLRIGPMNILEPAEKDIVQPEDVGVWLIPGLAFTRDGKRLGYGGGWYDRLLSEAAQKSLKIGITHDFQIVDDIPSEPHDIRIDGVVTSDVQAP
jgi:5-formyltetrahydrofolate cyclo-ligase